MDRPSAMRAVWLLAALPALVWAETVSDQVNIEVEYHEYTLTVAPGMTQDGTLVDDGSGGKTSTLWFDRTPDAVRLTFSIDGAEMVVTLVVPKGVEWSQEMHEVVVSKLEKGGVLEVPRAMCNPNATSTTERGSHPMSICNRDDRLNAVCLKDAHPEVFQRSYAVARLLTYFGFYCTVWRVWPGDLMMTNNHCLEAQWEIDSAEIHFNYQAHSCPSSGEVATSYTWGGDVLKVRGNSLLRTSKTLDYTLFTLDEYNLQIINDWRGPNGARIGHLQLETELVPSQGMPIYIPHHGGGYEKQISLRDDTDTTDGLCKLSSVENDGAAVLYRCDTIGGSSGAPVVLQASHKVVGLHHQGDQNCKTPNAGVSMNAIWREIEEFIPKETPAPPSAGDTMIIVGAVVGTVAVGVGGLLLYFCCRTPSEEQVAPNDEEKNAPNEPSEEEDADTPKPAVPCFETTSPFGVSATEVEEETAPVTISVTCP
eukprot:Hpha_TRINITY_DN16171_c3_g1::TRINITY_DN16171_c3_g1_i5::g.7677::m.7677